MDILFLSVSIGGGHLKAAEAIRDAVKQSFPLSRTMIVDTFKHINPIVDKLIVGSYIGTLKNTPQIYGKLYKLAESDENMHDVSKTLNKLLSYKIKKLIHEFKPSIIVCTHPFPLQMISDLVNKGKIHIPTMAILTDFAVHPFWLHDNVSAYVVANEYMKHEMVQKGIPDNIIHPFGIPVSNKFLQTSEKKVLLNRLDLDDKTTFLIMGGSLGFGEIRDIFLSLVNSKYDFQIIIITGNNIKLKKQLEKYSSHSKKKIRILGYTNNVSNFMDIADFIITKPGGMTIAESLVKGLPIFIISPIPGQEERNAHFLLNSGVAARILEHDNIDSILLQVVNNPLRVSHMKEMAKNIARPNAATNIVKLIEDII